MGTLFVLAAFPLVKGETAQSDEKAQMLDSLVVYGRSASLVGEAPAASVGQVGSAELAARPFLRRGELLEVVPGVIITQHSGDGKANQYFLRGFELDHGTDFATTVDGMPVNMPTNAHGQGYSDLNFIIPEFVQNITYQKGLSFAENGDFSSAGAAQFHLMNSLPRNFVKTEFGENDYFRGVIGLTKASGPRSNTTMGLEGSYNNGPWNEPEHVRRGNLFLRQSWTANESECAVTALGYAGNWTATDQVPLRAVEAGELDRFGTMDPSDGGSASRASLSFDWNRNGAGTQDKLNVYAVISRLSLYSNFTYFLNDPANGDQFNQSEDRKMLGGSFSRVWQGSLGAIPSSTTAGLQVRQDWVDVGLFNTKARARLSTVRDDTASEGNAGVYLKNSLKLAAWFRTEEGVRFDAYRFKVDSDLSDNSGSRSAAIASPKLNLIFGPWEKTEIYVNGGFGFHSNDARGVLTTRDPSSGEAVSRADPLVRAKSAEFGIRSARLSGLVSTLSLWAMDLDSELVFTGDSGGTEASGPTRRYGVEFANFYNATKWLAVDADLSLTNARYREAEGDDPHSGKYIPNSIQTVASAGVVLKLPKGFTTVLRMRYFGAQPLIEDNSVRGPSSLTYNGRIGWQGRNWEVNLDVLNLLNRADYDIAYYYESRLKNEATGTGDIHLHPAETRTVRLSMCYKF